MYRRIVAVSAGLCIALTGCVEPPRAGQPPAQQDALTQTTATPTPVTGDGAQATEEGLPEEVAVTSAVSSAVEESADGSLGAEDSFPDGPPEMPQVAWEHTEEGAAAFAEYYVGLIRDTGSEPRAGLLEAFSSDGCEPCANYEASVDYLIENRARNDSPSLTIRDSRAFKFGSQYEAYVEFDAHSYTVTSSSGELLHEVPGQRNVTMVLTLEPGEPWVIVDIKGKQ